MGNSKHLFNIVLIFIAVVLLYFGYRFLTAPSAGPVTGNNETPGLASSGFSSDDPTQAASDEFLETLTGLQGLNLNGDVFANPVFQDLQDANTVLPDETPGRQNPFAPINFANLHFPNVNATTTANPLDRLRGR